MKTNDGSAEAGPSFVLAGAVVVADDAEGSCPARAVPERRVGGSWWRVVLARLGVPADTLLRPGSERTWSLGPFVSSDPPSEQPGVPSGKE